MGNHRWSILNTQQLKSLAIKFQLEIKLDVPLVLSGSTKIKRNLAQLFLEIYYASRMNYMYKANKNHDDILGILTDENQWHFFLVEVKPPLDIKH